MNLTREEILFGAALDRPADERAAFLAGACHGDSALRQRLEALLAAHGQPATELALPAAEAASTVKATAGTEPLDEAVGQTLGRYKLLERVGEGGFGEVWLAEQREPVKRRVAVKIIKLGMDTKQVVARFEAERQALALMEHPNIAKVLDAGATELGRPFFVMELVKGIPITDYCETNRIGVKERLNLFIQVCRAIQHAHQKGIIHRDIKPSNILVTMQDGAPVPKVIDFGIAKATQMELTEKTIHTQLNQFIGTPAYMSPEQAEMTGIDIDTRSDIYSLGVLLYELLTGSTPFDTKELISAGLDQMRRIIREQEPPRPSTRISQLVAADGRRLTSPSATKDSAEVRASCCRLLQGIEGDLDWIVMKCIEKDRTRRYETANGLGLEIQRYLNNEAVTARPPSAAYRLEKAWQRNRLAFSAALALAAALLVGTVGTSIGFFRAERERAKAAKAALDEAAANVAAQHSRKIAEARALELETNAYFNLVALAHQQLTSEPSNIREAENLLANAPAKLRNWEWNYLKRLRFVDPFKFSILPEQQVHSLSFSPDERRLALACGDGSVRICDAATGAQEASLTGHTGYVASVSFSPRNSAWVASAGSDQTVKLWDWTERRTIGSWPGAPAMDYGLAYAVAFSPVSDLLAAPLGPDFVVREIPSGKERYRLPGHEIRGRSVAFSSDGQRLATTSDGGLLRIWDVETGRLLGKPLGPGAGPLTAVAFTSDGRKVLATRIVGEVHLWDVETGAESESFPMGRPPLVGLTVNSRSERFAIGGFDRMVSLFETDFRRPALVLRELASACNCVTFSPSGRLLAASGRSGAVMVWDATPLRGNEDRSVHSFNYPSDQVGQVWSMDVSPRNGEIAFGGRTIGVLATANPAPILRYRGFEKIEMDPLSGYGTVVFNLVYHPTRPFLISAGDNGQKSVVRVWDYERAREPFAFEEFEVSDPVFSVALTPDGRWLAGAGRGRKIRIWEAETGRKTGVVGEHSREIVKLAFSPDGRYLASLGNDDRSKLWDGTRLDQTQTELRTFSAISTGIADSLAFSPDSGRLAIVSGDDHAIIYDLENGDTRVRLLSRAHQPVSLAFSPGGRWIATGGADGAVEIWNSRTGELRHTFKAHADRVNRIQFLQISEAVSLVSASYDGTVKIWDVNFLNPL